MVVVVTPVARLSAVIDFTFTAIAFVVFPFLSPVSIFLLLHDLWLSHLQSRKYSVLER